MRPASFALLLPLTFLACDGKPLTGPDAQRAVATAKTQDGKLPAGTIVLIDGVRLTSDQSLSQLDPSTVQSVEILKGEVARHKYGPDATRGVILITTKGSSASQ